jgi:hypothetical protein
MAVLSASSLASQALLDSAHLNRAQRFRSESTQTTPDDADSVGEADSSDETGDVVTLSGNTAASSQEDAEGTALRSLSQLLRQMRPTLGTGVRAQGGAAGGLLGTVMSSFSQSLREMFSNQIQRNSGGRLTSIIDRLQEQLDQLGSMDPEQAERLGLLLGMLAVLDPERADEVLQKISSSMESLGNLMGSGSGTADAAAATDAAAQAAQAAQTSTQGTSTLVHFSLDFEMTSSQEISATLAQMRDQGIEVQAVRVETSQTFKIHIEFTAIQQQVQQSDPLVLDLNGDGVALTGYEDGAAFDINADGKTDKTAFVRGDDAFLVLDRNGNGRIDNGSELFGDQNGAVNGFEELRKYDDNRDGVIDGRDAIFDSLRLLHDKNGDGNVELTEMSSLAEKGITSLNLHYSGGERMDDAHHNTFAERSHYERNSGSHGALVDVWLGYQG